MNSLQGRILVASPHLHDPNFFQTAVLMVHHGGDGALGIVLNRPTEIDLAEACKKITDKPCRRQGTIFLGGPCEGPLVAIHRHESAGGIEVIAGIYFSAEQSDVEWLVGQDGDDLRFFLGSSGWAPGQLEQELESDAWIVIDATADHIFCEVHRWNEVLEKVARMVTHYPSAN